MLSTLLLVAVGAGDIAGPARPEPRPATVELADGWRLSSARDVPDGGSDLYHLSLEFLEFNRVTAATDLSGSGSAPSPRTATTTTGSRIWAPAATST